MKRCVFALLGIAAGLFMAGTAEAQYPDKPVRIIVPFIAGSAPDVAARQVAQRLTSGLGQQFVVENKPGAAGNIGAEVAAAVLAESLKDPAFRSALDSDGSEVVFNGPAEFATLLKSEAAKWQALIARIGVKLE